MKKSIVLLLLTLSTLIGFTQVRHVKGVKFIDVNYQYTFEGNGIELGYGNFFSKNFFFAYKLSHEIGKAGLTDFTVSGIKLQPHYALFNPQKRYYINPYLNVFAGYEQSECKILNLSNNKIIYHVGIGISQEIYLTSLAALNINVEQNIIGNSNIGKSYFAANVGLKIIINNLKYRKPKSLLGN